MKLHSSLNAYRASTAAPAALGVQRVALDVGEHREHEEQGADGEHQRRQALGLPRPRCPGRSRATSRRRWRAMANSAGWPRPRAIRSSPLTAGAPASRTPPGAAAPRPASANSDAEHHAERQRAAAPGQGADHHRHADQAQQQRSGPGGGVQGAVHVADPRPPSGPSDFLSMPSDESRITRHGRSASTVSSVRPNSERPGAALRGSGITIAAAWISCASLTIRRPAPPARTFSSGRSPGARRARAPGPPPPGPWPRPRACSASIGRVGRHGDRDQHVDARAGGGRPGARPWPRPRPSTGRPRRPPGSTRTPPRARRSAWAPRSWCVWVRLRPWLRR